MNRLRDAIYYAIFPGETVRSWSWPIFRRLPERVARWLNSRPVR